jgi:Fe-coproporphyrin III synthase
MRRNDLIFLKSVVESNFRRLRFPFKLSFVVTYRCNLRCEICNIWKKPRQDDELSLGEIESFFEQANQFSWVGITGGEPFLREDLFPIIDCIAGNCSRLSALHFATNGQLTGAVVNLVQKFHRRYPKIRLVLSVSIDGPTALHDRIRGANGAWDNAVRTFKELKRLPFVKAQVGFTLNAQNLRAFGETISSLKGEYPAFRSDDVSVNVFQKSGFYYQNSEMPEIDAQQLNEEIRRIIAADTGGFSFHNFLKRTYLRFYLKYTRSRKCPVRCQALGSTCLLDPYGNLLPCGIYDKKLMNIREPGSDFTSAWNSREARKLHHECSHHQCPGCWSPCDAYSAIGGSLAKVLFA